MNRALFSSVRAFRATLGTGWLALAAGLLPAAAQAQAHTVPAPFDSIADRATQAILPSSDGSSASGAATLPFGESIGASTTDPSGWTRALSGIDLSALSTAVSGLDVSALSGVLSGVAPPSSSGAGTAAPTTPAAGLDPSAVAPLLATLPASFSRLPPELRQQILAVLAQAQQRYAAAAARWPSGSPELSRAAHSIRSKSDARIRAITRRSQRVRAAAARRSRGQLRATRASELSQGALFGIFDRVIPEGDLASVAQSLLGSAASPGARP